MMVRIDNQHVSRILNTARLLRGWTLQTLAAISGLSVTTIHRVLAGKTENVFTVKLIADALGVPMADLQPAASTSNGDAA